MQDFFSEGELNESGRSPDRLAYIKAVDVVDASALGVDIPSDITLPPGVKLYVLHSANGTAIGISDSWAAAYSAAVQDNLIPVSVH